MKTFVVLFATLLTAGAIARVPGFSRVTLLDGGNGLMIYRNNGQRFPATRLQDQSGFAKPAISRDHRYVGWLVLQSGTGASYAQPTRLVVQDAREHVHVFSGGFGMVFGWCFATQPDAVTFMYSFPHGVTPLDFETVRISDGKILRYFELRPSRSDKAGDDVAPAGLPQWARCAWANARAQ